MIWASVRQSTGKSIHLSFLFSDKYLQDASFGAYLLSKDVLTMSFAPRDSRKPQVQFALERGIPAFVGAMGTLRLPFPSFSYDLVHCSRCLLYFTANSASPSPSLTKHFLFHLSCCSLCLLDCSLCICNSYNAWRAVGISCENQSLLCLSFHLYKCSACIMWLQTAPLNAPIALSK